MLPFHAGSALYSLLSERSGRVSAIPNRSCNVCPSSRFRSFLYQASTLTACRGSDTIQFSHIVYMLCFDHAYQGLLHSRRGCTMHVLNLGIWQTCVAEGILHLCEETFPQAVRSLPEQLRWAFRCFKDWLQLNKLSCSQRLFTVTNMHISSTDFAWLNAKAFNCRILVAWLAVQRMQLQILPFAYIYFAYMQNNTFRDSAEEALTEPSFQDRVKQRRADENEQEYRDRLFLSDLACSCLFSGCNQPIYPGLCVKSS